MHKLFTPARRAGFTVVELMVSAAIMTLVMGGALATFIYGLRTWRAETIVSELHQDLEKAMEHIRYDLRLSSAGVGLMSFYPTNAAEYTAISFPLSTPGNDGMLRRNLDTNSPNYGQIVWDQTVIYHVRPGTPDELLRTVFTPRDSNAAPHDFYTQLRQVALSSNVAGLQAAAREGESVSSRVVFRNLVTMRIRPPDVLFDGYAPGYQRARNLNWGSVVLGDGINDLTFTVVGKNPDSSGYKVGIDWFSLSPSASRREGEIFLPADSHPVSPFYRSIQSGGTVSAQDMSAHGAGWGGNCQLTYNAGAIGNSITFKVQNDLWCDSQFDAPPGVIASNVSRKCDTNFIAQAPYIPDYVMDMDKGITWTAENATDGAPGGITLTNDVPVINIIYNGARACLNFQAPTNGQLFVDNVKIMRQLSGTNPVDGTVQNVTFAGSSWRKIGAGGEVWSDWINFPFDRNASCLVSFQLKTDALNLANARTWSSTTTNPPMSYLNNMPHNQLIGLGAIAVLYPSNAVYRSGIFDTRLANPSYRLLNWTQVEPWPYGDIDIRVRSGDQRDLSDACAWDFYGVNNDNNNIAGISGGRYVQYEVLYNTIQPHTNNAILRDVTISWAGSTGLVDLVVGFARGPDYGIVQAAVNGQSFIKGIEVEMEIFKEGPFGASRVSGLMEVRPLNTGK